MTGNRIRETSRLIRAIRDACVSVSMPSIICIGKYEWELLELSDAPITADQDGHRLMFGRPLYLINDCYTAWNVRTIYGRATYEGLKRL